MFFWSSDQLKTKQNVSSIHLWQETQTMPSGARLINIITLIKEFHLR